MKISVEWCQDRILKHNLRNIVINALTHLRSITRSWNHEPSKFNRSLVVSISVQPHQPSTYTLSRICVADLTNPWNLNRQISMLETLHTWSNILLILGNFSFMYRIIRILLLFFEKFPWYLMWLQEMSGEWTSLPCFWIRKYNEIRTAYCILDMVKLYSNYIKI